MKKFKISLKRLTAQRLIYLQIIYNLFIKWGIAQFGLSGSMNYVADVITVLLFVELLFHRMNGYKPNTPIAPTRMAIAFLIYTLVNWVMHLYSPIYYLWGFRNTFRFYVFFAACTAFLEKEDIQKIINITFYVFIANVIMCTYQYFVMGRKMDYIAGFMGSTEATGGNGGIVILSSLVCLTTVVQYIETRDSIIKPLIAIAGALFLATIAETKMLYILVAMIVAMASLFTRFSVKKLLIISAIFVLMPVAIKMLYELYPNFSDFFEMESIMEYAAGDQGYTGRGGINRLNSISFCFENFLETPFDRIFGLGMGSADGSSNFRIVTSDFYIENFHTNYVWFVVPMILIENGIIGLILFWGFYLLVFMDATKLRKRNKVRKINSYIIITQIFSLTMILMSFLSMSTKTEVVGYLCYAMMAIPYILRKDSQGV